jgi:gamma-glutamylcysteine synthetase
MEQHFAVTGRAAAGRVMMNSTAALQVNLQAGLRGQRRERVARAYRIGPTLVAIAASSSWQHGRDSGVGAAGAYLFDFLTNTWPGHVPRGLRRLALYESMPIPVTHG